MTDQVKTILIVDDDEDFVFLHQKQLQAEGFNVVTAENADDGNTAVSFPEVPLLGVLPGTGGLTRLVDKRKVRRDRADVFSTVAEGIKGKRAVKWNLVDEVVPSSKFKDAVENRARQLAESRLGAQRMLTETEAVLFA